MNVKKWTKESIEASMLRGLYGDQSRMLDVIEGALRLYQKSKSDHPEIKNRIDILKQLKEKYQDK